MSAIGSWTECGPGAFAGSLILSKYVRDSRVRTTGSGRVRGFTLLEILVVMFIIGLMFSLAILSVGDGGQEQNVRREAERFGALLALAQERAVLEAREFSVSFTEQGYGFLVLEEDAWHLIADDELFRERTLPEGISFELAANDLPVDLSVPGDDKKGPRPHVLVLSSGELTPFDLKFFAESGSVAYRIEGELQGEISFHHGEDAL